MGQPTQRATNYTARSNIVTAQMFLHANGQRPKRASNRQRSRRRQARGATHRARPRSPSQHISHSHSGIDEKRPTEKFVRRTGHLQNKRRGGPKTPTRVAAPSPRASLGRRTVCGRTEQRRPPVSKRYETKVRMVWGNILIAAVALKLPTRNG